MTQADLQTFIGRTLDESVIPQPAAVKLPKRPNIVLWVMDDVGFGNLSPYGGLVDMPALQRLVDRGMRFTNAHVTPLCTTTRACLLTGRNHHSSHMPAIPRFSSGLAAHDTRIPREHGFLSEMLLTGYDRWTSTEVHRCGNHESGSRSGRGENRDQSLRRAHSSARHGSTPRTCAEC